MDNYELPLLKNVRLTESRLLQFRGEGSTFSITHKSSDRKPSTAISATRPSTFARVVSAQSARLVQLSAKFFF